MLPALVLFLGIGIAQSHAAMVFATLASEDYIVGERESGGSATGYYPDATGTGQAGVGGGSGTRENRNLILGFTLPILDGPLTLANFSITVSSTSASAGAINVDLYGLATANPNSTGISLFFEAGDDATQTKLKDTFADTGAAVASVQSQTVTAFIQSFYTGNTPNQAEVFFRINPDRDLSVASSPRRVSFTNGSATLELTTVPEPSTALLGALGCLALLRRKR